MVHALGRAAGGAKLPSVGLSLNASKAESRLAIVATISLRSPEGRKARKYVTLLGAVDPRGAAPYGPNLFAGRGARAALSGICSRRRPAPTGRPWVSIFRCRDSESSVDDLGTGRGVVLGRAVATLRSVETQP